MRMNLSVGSALVSGDLCTMRVHACIFVQTGVRKAYFGDYCQCDHLNSCGGSFTMSGEL